MAHDVIIIGGGLAGLSAGIYLGRSKRDTLLIDSGHSMAVWEPEVQNYLGFPDGVAGATLLEHGRTQARRYGTVFVDDEVLSVRRDDGVFAVEGRRGTHTSQRVL